MSELKNKFGDNIAWLLQDVAEQVKYSIEYGNSVESSFEIWGETEDGREARCDVDLVDILESSIAEMFEQEKSITIITKQRDELARKIKLISTVNDTGEIHGFNELLSLARECDSQIGAVTNSNDD